MKRKSEKGCEIKSEEDYCNFEPRLTRSKTKKLLQGQPNIVWPIARLKKKTDLLNDELPEESDDEEYKPNLDDLQDQSEEESGRQSVVSTVSHSSTLDISVSQYLENFDANLLENSPVKSPSDHVFKVPEENIGQRTRSKLCLSDTPLEAIEKAFVFPDITTDMYNFNCDDENWENFLKEFMQPLSNDLDDDDDEADPEYYTLADEEQKHKEELQEDRTVKISRTEWTNMMAELFEFPEELSSDEEEERRVKTEIANKVNLGTKEKAKHTDKEKEEKSSTLLTKSQVLLLQQQLRQHVQLTTQHFLQTCEHPLYTNYARDCKIILATLLELSKTDKNKFYNIYNLESAFSLVEKWEAYLLGKDGPSVKEHMKNEIALAKKAKDKGNYHRITLHSSLLKLMSESTVFLYPLLLPPNGFRCDGPLKMEFVAPEDSLIAIGLDEFSQHLKKHPRWFDRIKQTEKAACELISEYLMPVKKAHQIGRHIRHVKNNDSNPINYYKQHKEAPKTVHFVIPFNEKVIKPPCKQRKEMLPEMFRHFIYRQNINGENKENDHG